MNRNYTFVLTRLTRKMKKRIKSNFTKAYKTKPRKITHSIVDNRYVFWVYFKGATQPAKCYFEPIFGCVKYIKNNNKQIKH